MSNFSIGEFVWAKMTGYPYWPGKVVQPDKDVKRPSKKTKMYFIKFFGTGDFAWTKADLIHKYDENKEKYSQGSKRSGFVDAVKNIEDAVQRRKEGKVEVSEEETPASGSESEESDDLPLSKKAENGRKSPSDSAISPPFKKRRKLIKKTLQTREEKSLSTDHSPSMSNANARLSAADTVADADSTTNIITKDIIPTDKKIGFLGLGIMGVPMALNLLRAGHDVTVWNRSQSRCEPLIDAGAKEGISPADVVQQCDITFSCVSDSDAVRDLVVGNSGVLQGICAGKGYVEMSTVDTETITEISEAITMRGGRFLEAPVSGNKKSAEAGQLVILAAGDRSLYMDAYSCFEALGKKTFFLGELGSGSNTKLIVNMLMGTFMTSLAEGLSLAEKAGLDQYMLLDVLNLSDISCPLVKAKGSAVLEGHFPANFPLKHQQKDMRLALQMGEKLEQPLHVAGAANELFKRTKAIGFGDRDMSCVYRAVNP